jgi:2-keto-4-pentenoate hydratase/2-oxohepta-3-ene-1,7-dioic acid hydratase in catechol pathway
LGCGLEHLRFLNHGDIVELEVEKIGVISNRVIREGNVNE